MSGPAVFGPDVYASKRDVTGEVVVVLRGVTDQRGLSIEDLRSRAVPRYAIHELMSTDESGDLGTTANRVALLAFFEVTTGGVILVGDEVHIGGRRVGVVAGFNETHMPNHQNICLRVDQLIDGESLELQVGDPVVFTRP